MSKIKEEPSWVVVGRFGRPHGLKGLVSVYSYTEPRDQILDYPEWYALISGQWTRLKILSTEQHNRFIAALVDGYLTREKSAELTNIEIAVPSQALPALTSGEFYWRELVGMSVLNTQGLLLGSVVEIFATGANDVLVVEGEARHLIPFRYGVVVLAVNEKERQITVDWDGEYL